LKKEHQKFKGLGRNLKRNSEWNLKITEVVQVKTKRERQHEKPGW